MLRLLVPITVNCLHDNVFYPRVCPRFFFCPGPLDNKRKTPLLRFVHPTWCDPVFGLGKSRNMPRLAGARLRTLEWDKFTKESTMRSTAVFLIIYYCRGALSRLHMSRLRPPPMLTPSPSCIPPLSARHHCRILSFSTPRLHTDRIRHKYAPS